MGEAFQCDRCGSFDQGKPVLRVILKTLEPPVKDKDYDLCPTCLSSLHDWLGVPKDSPHE